MVFQRAFLILGMLGSLTGFSLGKTLYFPHYGDGGGLSMLLVVNNPGQNQLSAVLRIFNSSGQPTTLPFDTGDHSRLDLAVAPNGTRVLKTLGTSSPVKSGYITVESGDEDLSGVAIFQFESGLEAAVLPSDLGPSFSLYVEKGQALDTGFAVFRTNPSAAIRLTLFDDRGRQVGSSQLSNFSAQTARFVAQSFPAIGDSFVGLMRLDSAAPFAVVGLRFGGTVLSTIPVVADPPAEPAGSLSLQLDESSLLIVEEFGDFFSINGRVVSNVPSDAIFVQVAAAVFGADGRYLGGDSTFIHGTNRILTASGISTNTCLLEGEAGFFDLFLQAAGDPVSVEFLVFGELDETIDPRADIEVTDFQVVVGSFGNARVVGSLRNSGTQPLSRADLDIILLDSSERVLGIDSTFPDDRSLAPGETTTFSEETLVERSRVSRVEFRPEWDEAPLNSQTAGIASREVGLKRARSIHRRRRGAAFQVHWRSRPIEIMRLRGEPW